MARLHDAQSDVGALSAAAFLGGALLLVPNTLPLVLGIIATRFNASAIELGLINSVYNGAGFVATVTAPVWLRRLRQRPTAMIAAIVLVGTMASISLLPSITWVLGTFAVVGLSAGIVSAPGNAALGNSAFPARWFGVSAGMQLGLAAIFALLLPLIEQSFGQIAGLVALSVLLLPCLPASAMLRQKSADSKLSVANTSEDGTVSFRQGTSREKGALIAAFGALVAYVLAAISYWIFVERMARASGLDDSVIAFGVTAGIVSAGIGALLFTVLARHALAASLAGFAMAVTAYVLMFKPTALSLLASLVLFNVAWGLLTPALTTVIRRADFTGRIFVSSGAGILIAGTVGGPPAGMIVMSYGFEALLLTAIGVTLTAIPLVLIAVLRSPALPLDATPLVATH